MKLGAPVLLPINTVDSFCNYVRAPRRELK
jgi:hypothetical protein